MIDGRRAAFVGGLLALCGCVIRHADESLAGDWSGTYTDGKSSAQGSISATFAQQGTSLTGTLSIPGWACSVSSQGNLTGTIDGAAVQLSATFGLITALSMTGDAAGSKLTGTYSVTSGVCSGDSGSFSMTK